MIINNCNHMYICSIYSCRVYLISISSSTIIYNYQLADFRKKYNCYRVATILLILMQFHIFINTVKPMRDIFVRIFIFLRYWMLHQVLFILYVFAYRVRSLHRKINLECGYKFMKENRYSSYLFNNRIRWHCLAWETR